MDSAQHQCSRFCERAGCASAMNIMATKHSCPENYVVSQITPSTNSTKPYCTWIVEYTYKHGNMQYYKDHRAKNIFTEICVYLPSNVSVHRKSVRHAPPSYCVEYAVRSCLCKKPEFNLDLTQPFYGVLLDSKDILNIKIEDENI